MKKKNLLSAVFILITALSCDKNNDPGIIITPPTPFHFLEKKTIIEVDETTQSFELGGVFSEEPIYNKYFPAKLDTRRSTAKHKFHFINNKTDLYDRRDGLKVYQIVELIPENIKEEVQLVYYVNYGGLAVIDTTTIVLRPKK